MTTIEQVLAHEVRSGRTPSVQYYLFNRDSILRSHGLGYAQIAQEVRISDQATFHAYSVTKTFTAVAVLQLAERGMINIDQPAARYLPGFPYGDGITVRQLLAHTAGLPNPNPLNWIHLHEEHGSFDRDSFFRDVFASNPRVKSAPNERFAYSNLGYVLLGQLVEQVTGGSYEEYINVHIAGKLGLRDQDLSFVVPDPLAHATGYQKRMSLLNLLLGLFINKRKFMGEPEGAWRPFRSFYVNGTAYGGLVGNPRAFVRYGQELLKDGGVLISPESRKILFEENKNAKGEKTGMCLSWFVGKLLGNTYYTHAGGGGGYYCEVRLYPDLNIGSVIFFNRTGTSDQRFLDRLDRFYLQDTQTVK
jgi:CubicO group peptidase (beta-lactamase class C family)